MCKKTVHVTPVQVCGACVFSSPLDDFPLSSSSHLYLQSEMTWRHSAKQCPAPSGSAHPHEVVWENREGKLDIRVLAQQHYCLYFIQYTLPHSLMSLKF